jgi:alpha-beta hydrolase superfamily lysophospholipase/DNA-binding CsgD family transcriptional regulator
MASVDGDGRRAADAATAMQTRNLFTADGVALVTRRVVPARPGRGVAYVAHGQAQHSLNHAPFLHALAARGWTVQATDLRGHGHSASGRAPLAHMEVGSGWDRLVDDMRAALRAAFDGVAWEDRLVVAPNIGAALVLEVLKGWPDLAARIVFVAPPTLNTAILGLGRTFMAARVRLRAADAPDELALHHMYSFLAAQLPERRSLIDVVSSDRALTEALIADPLAWPTPTSGYFHEMFRGLAQAWTLEGAPPVRPGTRLMILHGDEDPVTANGRFLDPLRRNLARIGLERIERVVLPGGRSGLLAEEARFGLAALVDGWAVAGLPACAAPPPDPAPPAAEVTGRVLDRLGVPDPGEPLAEDVLVELCYHAIDDDSRWIELLYRLAHALGDEGGLPQDRLEAVIAALMPHWERAFGLNRQIAQAAAVGTVLQNVIDRFRIGVAIVDADLGVLFANAGFARALDPGGPGPADTARLTARVRALCDGALRDLLRRGAGETLILHGGEAAGYYFRPAALRQTTLHRGGATGVIVLRDAAEDGADQRLDLLQFAYGLTLKEAETAAGLLDGLGAEAIAARLGVSLNTVRTHLKRVYDKTGVRTQTELVARLLRGPIGLLSGTLGRQDVQAVAAQAPR